MAANNNCNAAPKEYESLMAEIKDLITSDLSESEKSYIIQIAKDLRYCNYDPKALHKKIAKVIANKKWNTTRSIGEITKAVAVGLVRGNITRHQIEKIGGINRDRILQLAANFGIQIRKNTSEKIQCKPDTLTFVRFLSLFPNFASRLCLTMPSNLTQKIPCDGVYSACILPIGMKHSGFASLIPAGPDYRAVRGYLSVAFTAFMVEFSDAIMNPNKSNRSPQVKFVEQFRLTETAIEDSKMTDEKRIVALKVAMVNSKVALERILRVVENVRRANGMAVEDTTSYMDDPAAVDGDLWKLGHTREIEDETGDVADRAIEGMKKKYPDYGTNGMDDHTGCSSLSSSTVAAAPASIAVFPGLTGFPI